MVYYYYGSGSCSPNLFDDTDSESYLTGLLAIDGLGVFASGVLAVVYLAICIVRRHSHRIVPWYLFGIAVVFSLISWILSMIGDVLTDCEIIGPKTSLELWAPANILFYGLVYYLFLAVFLFPLTTRVMSLAGIPTKIYQVGAASLLFVSFALWIAETVILYYVRFNEYSYTGEDRVFPDLVKAYYRLGAATTTFYFVASLVAMAANIYAITRLSGTAATTGLKVALCIALVFWLASNLLSMIESLKYGLTGWRGASTETRVATGILDIIFLLGAAFAMIFVAASRTWRADTALPDAYANGNGNGYNGYGYDDGAGQHHKPGQYGGAQEVSGVGRSTLYPYAPTGYTGSTAQTSELASPVSASEVHGHSSRFEAPGHVPAGLH